MEDKFKRPETVVECVRGIIDSERMLSTLTGNDNQRVPAYWVRTTEEMSKAITQKIISEYNNVEHPNNQCYPDRVTPEHLRFPGIRRQIREIYEAEEEQLSQKFIQSYVDADGKKRTKINNDWLKIDRDLDSDGHGEEDINLTNSIRENAGYRITAVKYSPEEIRNGKVDIELPLSEIFRAALWVDNKRKGVSPRFPYLIMWYCFHLFLLVMGEQCCQSIKDAIEMIWERKEKLLERPSTVSQFLDSDIKDKVAPFINTYSKEFGFLAEQINSCRPEMTDERVDSIVAECDRTLNIFTQNGEMDLIQVISKLTSADESTIRTTMNAVGLSEANIQNMIEGNNPSAISNDELKSTIPTEGTDFSRFFK